MNKSWSLKRWAAPGMLAGAVIATLLTSTPLQAQPAAAPEFAGALANGTKFVLHRPPDWNGVLVLDADLPAPGGRRGAPLFGTLHRLGYATGGRSRDVTGWEIRDGSSDLVQLKSVFEDRYGKAKRTIVTGRSLGGLVARDAGETYPGFFDGAIPGCGGGAGLIAMWNQRLDVSFAMKTLLAPGNQGIELVRVTDDQRNAREMKAVTEAALRTPEGKARLALLAGIGQISGWPSSMPEPPAADDYDTRLKTIADSVAGMLNLRTGVEKPAGGALNWNTDVDYLKLFEAADAETRAMAVEFYRRAGLDMQKDFASLAAAPRIQADATSVAWARHNGSANGKLTRPTLALFTAVDPRAPLSEFRAYEQIVRDAGAIKHLRQAGVYRSGHCSFTTAELVTAITVMDETIRKGKWPVTTPAALNARANALIARLGEDIGEARFADFPGTPEFARPFNAATPLPTGALRP